LNLIRTHESDGVLSTAEYSNCELYRYALTRVWDTKAPKLAYVMLNPSTADELRNDPTVERCERRARSLGFGAFRVVNIFAFRATNPKDLKLAKDPEGPGNKLAMTNAIEWADQVLAAWGAHGDHLDQGNTIAALLKAQDTPLAHLGLTQMGHPRHPLYVSYSQDPIPWAVVNPG